eukprot:367430-Rhodomonas_salina.4
MRCPVLTERTGLRALYAVSGTYLAHRPTHSLGAEPAECGTTLCLVLTSEIDLRGSYAVSGTELVSAYVVSGTDIGYRVSGTDIGYRATWCLVLTPGIGLPGIWSQPCARSTIARVVPAMWDRLRVALQRFRCAALLVLTERYAATRYRPISEEEFKLMSLLGHMKNDEVAAVLACRMVLSAYAPAMQSPVHGSRSVAKPGQRQIVLSGPDCPGEAGDSTGKAGAGTGNAQPGTDTWRTVVPGRAGRERRGRHV